MTLLRRIPLLAWIVAPILLAALIAWPFGGWDTVTVKSTVLPELANGKVFHGHRFRIAVDDVTVTTSYPGHPDRKPKAGMTYLVARVDATNVWHEPSSVSPLTNSNLILEKGKYDGALGPDVVLDSDYTSLPELNLDVPRALDLIWTVPAGAVNAGDVVQFTFYDSIPRAGFVIHGTSWVDLFPAAVATRTVK